MKKPIEKYKNPSGHRQRLRNRFLRSGREGLPDYELLELLLTYSLPRINTIGGLGDNGHVVMATHDPLVISGLTRKQVRVMLRDSMEEPIRAEMPEVDPQGMGINGLLRSELYGLRTALDQPTLEKIDKRDALRSRQKELQAKGKT